MEGRGNRIPSGPCQTQGETLRARRARVYPRTVSGVWRSLQLVTDGPHGFLVFPPLSSLVVQGGQGKRLWCVLPQEQQQQGDVARKPSVSLGPQPSRVCRLW